MAVDATVKKGSYGAEWEIDTGINLTGATEVGIRLRNEVGTVTEYEGASETPSSGIIEWTDLADLWDEVGYWKLESYAEFSSAKRYGEPALIKVEATLNG